jgi:hypothetical protein
VPPECDAHVESKSNDSSGYDTTDWLLPSVVEFRLAIQGKVGPICERHVSSQAPGRGTVLSQSIRPGRRLRPMKFEFHPTRLSNLAVGQKLSARVIGVWCSETGVKSEDQPRGYNWGYGNLLTIGPHNRYNSQFTVRDFVFFL